MAVANGTSTAQARHDGDTSSSPFDSISSCIEDFAAGNFLIVLDSPTRENEGDLIISAAHLTPAKAAFMIRYTSGYLCAPMSAARAKLLDLPPMVAPGLNADPNRTAYAITVDAVAERGGEEYGFEGGVGVSTGISAHDRAVTCRVLADPRARAADLRRPGHVVPLLARDGGVRVRRGHTEAGWEFARLAGIEPAVAVIGEMVVDGEPAEAGAGTGTGTAELKGGGMMRMEECLEFGRRWGVKCCTIEDLVEFVEGREGRVGNGA